MNKLFGPGWGDAPLARDLEHVEVPVGQTCLDCDEPIEAGDSGILLLHVTTAGSGLRPWHRECNLRGVFGGIYHQMKLCTCCGGSLPPDPPGLTRREAAKLAVRLYEYTHGLVPNV